MNGMVPTSTDTLDKRLNAFRGDLADMRLKGKVESACFVDGVMMRVGEHFADVLAAPQTDSGLLTQFLYGHDVLVFETKAGWAWVQSVDCGYVGYVREETLTPDPGALTPATHMVCAPRTFIYRAPDLKQPRTGVPVDWLQTCRYGMYHRSWNGICGA